MVERLASAKRLHESVDCRVVIHRKAEFLVVLQSGRCDVRFVDDLGYRVMVRGRDDKNSQYLFSSVVSPEAAFAQIANEEVKPSPHQASENLTAPKVPQSVFELAARASSQTNLKGTIDFKHYAEHAVCIDERGHLSEYKTSANGLRLIYELQSKASSFMSGHAAMWSGDPSLDVNIQDFVDEWTDSQPFLKAPVVTAGTYPCLFNPQVTGYFVHECVGHMLEKDFYPYDGMFPWQPGDEVAASCVTVVDDPTKGGPVGYYLFDQEGSPAQPTVLIDQGRFTAALNRQPGCNARAKCHYDISRVRMSNTYMEPGTLSLKQLERLCPERFLWIDSVNWGTGVNGFKLSVRKAYDVKGGVKTPIRAHLVTAPDPSCLRRIVGISNEFESNVSLFRGCAKIDQRELPVQCGGPHMVIDQLSVL